MTWPLTITVYYDPQRLSPNLRLHWSERQRRQHCFRTAAFVAWVQAGQPRSAAPVRVDVTAYRARRVDPDNLVASVKGAWDRLFCSARSGGDGITPDDNADWVEIGTVAQVIAATWHRREQVVFTIHPRETPTATLPADAPVDGATAPPAPSLAPGRGCAKTAPESR